MPKKVSKKSTKKSASKKAAAPPAPVKEVKPAAAPVEQVAEAVPTMGDQFTALLAQLSALRAQLTTVTSQVRTLRKRADRELKQAQKQGRKKRKSGNRAPSGFVKPTKISVELATFLGKAKGTEMARTEVTREINAYIREHKLQDKNNGRVINADKKLSSLLKLKSSDELTYFNLQKYMSPHFAKSSATATSA